MCSFNYLFSHFFILLRLSITPPYLSALFFLHFFFYIMLFRLCISLVSTVQVGYIAYRMNVHTVHAFTSAKICCLHLFSVGDTYCISRSHHSRDFKHYTIVLWHHYKHNTLSIMLFLLPLVHYTYIFFRKILYLSFSGITHIRFLLGL